MLESVESRTEGGRGFTQTSCFMYGPICALSYWLYFSSINIQCIKKTQNTCYLYFNANHWSVEKCLIIPRKFGVAIGVAFGISVTSVWAWIMKVRVQITIFQKNDFRIFEKYCISPIWLWWIFYSFS